MSVQLDAELRDALGNLNHETSTTNWYIAGYRDTRDTLSLYAKGTGHLKEFREFVEIMGGEEPVLYGFVRTEAGSGTWALLTVLSERVGAVDRARAMVHARAVVKLYEVCAGGDGGDALIGYVLIIPPVMPHIH